MDVYKLAKKFDAEAEILGEISGGIRLYLNKDGSVQRIDEELTPEEERAEMVESLRCDYERVKDIIRSLRELNEELFNLIEKVESEG